jgi:hypothetical protein
MPSPTSTAAATKVTSKVDMAGLQVQGNVAAMTHLYVD